MSTIINNFEDYGFLKGLMYSLFKSDFRTTLITIGLILLAIFIFSFIREMLKMSHMAKIANAGGEAVIAGDKFEKDISICIKNSMGAVPVSSCIFATPASGGEGFVDDDTFGFSGVPITTTEADIIYVTTKGIYCVECKHREGAVFSASRSSEYWFAENGESINHNPFSQNFAHIAALRKALDEKYEFNPKYSDNIYNVVNVSKIKTFTENGIDHNIEKDGYFVFTGDKGAGASKANIIENSMDGVWRYAKEMKKQPDVFTEKEVSELTEWLQEHHATEKQHKIHADYIAGAHMNY